MCINMAVIVFLTKVSFWADSSWFVYSLSFFELLYAKPHIANVDYRSTICVLLTKYGCQQLGNTSEKLFSFSASCPCLETRQKHILVVWRHFCYMSTYLYAMILWWNSLFFFFLPLYFYYVRKLSYDSWSANFMRSLQKRT